MVYKAMDVARMVIALTDEEHGDLITNLKLQKLLFYLQGFWLAEYGEPLFAERVEAWAYGPVVPEIYHAFKRYGRDPFNIEKEGKPIDFATDERRDFFLNVYDTFSSYSASALMRMTHEEAPWKAAWSCGKGTEITQAAMQRHFKTRIDD